MSHIFISYSKKNSDYAYALADFLQAQGFNIWIDRVGIEYGVGWWDAIVEGLLDCGAFIVIMTPEARASDWVQREVFIALQEEKPIFPVLLNGDNWHVFVLTQYAIVSNGSMPDKDLLRRLGEHVTPKRNHGENKSTLTPEKQSPAAARFDIDQAIANFGKAYRNNLWSEALEILGRIRASGEDPTPFDPDDFQQKVQAQIEEEQRQREQAQYEAERDRLYNRILTLADFGDSESVWNALQTFWQTYPDYDPNELAEQVRPQPKIIFPTNPVEQNILPEPFEWIHIPAGKVELEDGHGWFDVDEFYIAKYPLTNAQFAPFIKDGDYKNRQWWTDAGWQQREKSKWTEPSYWQDAKWNGKDYPVVGVSWYEALAYCRWLSEVTGDNNRRVNPAASISLPSEHQWQRAAQGDDGRAYPWGNEFDKNRCNSDESGIGKTTPVTQYPNGASPYGVMDMSGNVWEWCLSEYDNPKRVNIEGDARRVLRGGSWSNLHDYARSASRIRDIPHFGYNNYGFRVVSPTS